MGIKSTPSFPLSSSVLFALFVACLSTWNLFQVNGLSISQDKMALPARQEDQVVQGQMKKGPHGVLSLVGAHRSDGLLAETPDEAACFPMMGGGSGTGTGTGAGGAGDAANAIEDAVERRLRRMRMAARKRRQRNARKKMKKLIENVKGSAALNHLEEELSK